MTFEEWLEETSDLFDRQHIGRAFGYDEAEWAAWQTATLAERERCADIAWKMAHTNEAASEVRSVIMEELKCHHERTEMKTAPFKPAEPKFETRWLWVIERHWMPPTITRYFYNKDGPTEEFEGQFTCRKAEWSATQFEVKE